MALASPRSLPLALVALAVALPATAHASAFDDIFHEYQKTGKINPCHFSKGQLKQAQGQVPNDVEAYAPDFPAALQTALEQRASSSCGTPKSGGAAAPAPAAAPATSTPTPPPAAGATATPAPTPDPTIAPAANDQAIARTASSVRDSDAGVPAPIVALAVLGGLLALGGLGYGLAHWLAWDPRWARNLRHAMAEAGWRAGTTWSEFTDWVRLGR